MDQDSVELSQERAISSEPYSTRPHPTDANEQSARKRQRTSRRASRSRSVDTNRTSDILPDSMSPREEGNIKKDQPDPPLPPSTPPPHTTGNSDIEPTSSRVTINLRTPHPHPLDSIPSTPPSPVTPSKMVTSVEDEGAGNIMETESDALSTLPAIETPSSPSEVGSPEIELVADNSNDSPFSTRSPPLAIIDGDDVFADHDPMNNFPFYRQPDLHLSAKRVGSYLQYEPIESDDAFVQLRDWIQNFLQYGDGRDDYFHDAFNRHKDFWASFTSIIWGLNNRSRFFGEFMHRHNSASQSLLELFLQFGKLTGRFLKMDVQTLYHVRSDEDQIPDLASPIFLPAYGWLLRQDDTNHIGRNLENHYGWKWEEDIASLPDYFEDGGGSILHLTKFVEGQLKFMTRNPRIIESLSEPSRLVERTLKEHSALLRQPQQGTSQREIDGAYRKITKGYEYFNVMSRGLETIIEKHVTFLSPDAATTHLSALSSILSMTITCSVRAVKGLLDNQRKIYPEVAEANFWRIIPLEWKFSILKKLITSAQMQLRVVGVTTMCHDLLNIFNIYRYKEGATTVHQVLLYFADYVLRHKLVDYLVGLGSHPEIINESNNIVGFLIVTKTYKPEQTDTIWQTVMTSQDPRVVEAILRMLKRCLGLYTYQSLLYLCQKVAALPIEAFTVAMRDFCESLFKDLTNKITADGIAGPTHVDPPPYELCVRLIRESSITSANCPDGYPDIQNFAVNRLRELLVHGPGQQVRNDIYHGCIEDMSAKTPTAPGSICVIHLLLRQNLATDIHVLTTEHGLTKLVIDELEFNLSSNRFITHNSPAGVARRDLILIIITYEPDTITNELGTRLWSLLVGAQSKDISNRQAGWQILNSAAKRTTLKNRYLTVCFQKHLPQLLPDCFMNGALDFVREGIYSWLTEVKHDFVEQDLSFESLALEQLWRMILTAPPKTIDAPAITVLVEVYTESALIINLPRIRARKIHLALINRCLEQLAKAAANLKLFSDDASGSRGDDDEDMVIVVSESQVHDQELVFTRSLAVLREFLKAYQSKPQFATPKMKSTTAVPSDVVQGKPLTVMYQSFDGNKQTDVKTLTMGTLNTAASLFASLQKATGFTHYKVFYGGKLFDPDETEVCQSLEDLNLNGLVLVQRREDADGLPGISSGNNGSLELEITKHFDEIWSYLSMQDKVAAEIYYFLVQFPVYKKVLQDLGDATISYKEIFPLGQPYKALYALYVLREYISTHSLKGSVDEAVFDRAITLHVAAISDPDVLERCATEEIRHCLAMNLVSSFASLLKEPSLPQSATALLDAKLLERLLHLLYTAKAVTTTAHSVHLTWNSFDAVIETAIQNPTLWGFFITHLNTTTLLQELVLEDSRVVIRKSVAKHISTKCTFSPNHTRVSTLDITTTLWPIVAKLIPEATSNRQQCEETFTLALNIFKRLSDTTLDIDLNAVVRGWGSLLLAHETIEEFGHPESVDLVANGLTNLLSYAVSITKVTEQKLACSDLGPKLFRKHLFPDLSVDDPEQRPRLVAPKVPLLNSLTRHHLGDTIFNLVKDNEVQYKVLLQLLADVVPYDSGFEIPYAWEPTVVYDRSKAIRSPTGYVGLRNLSNTCYLNSLLTQLFMNVSFREFIFQQDVVLDGASQKLLSETQLLFAYMQNSMKRFVDPTNFANTIRTFDDAQIDVTVQMDVDEFYNLLFDRWERQILAPDAKRTFRSFYGGKLVQQIKSKECSHISEILEDFSAIQCDIKGKSSLQESLQAYVDGEVMEGDNKYKCSTCDRHVDAVKRACLKDVPNNLIFHLKRFDFNLRTLQRSKINDYFAFPQRFDMRPYKVEHLMDPGADSEEDIFELVGVLVHSGTAESGHYYSYIRERPSTADAENWSEFNDDIVSPWDPTTMEANCFGGVDVRGTIDAGNMQYEKNYSAYMLFYQRSSELAVSKRALQQSGGKSPVKLPVAPRLSAHLAMENELLIRKYCLYDQCHPAFVMKMIKNVHDLNDGHCSDLHDLEKQVMHVALCHLDQVISRTKDLPDFENYLLTLKGECQNCGECSRDFLEYFCDATESLRFMLMKSPEVDVRTGISNSIVSALTKIKVDLPYAYGLEKVEDDDGVIDVEQPKILQKVVYALNHLYESFHNSLRAWPEYFGLLNAIANLGDHEAAVLLDAGFLLKTLDIITADPSLEIGTQLNRMLALISKRSTSRPVSFDSVIGLLHSLLQVCEGSGPSISSSLVDDTELRLPFATQELEIPFTNSERERLYQHWTRNNVHILTEKLLQINQNQYATQAIISILLHYHDSLDSQIYSAIQYGVRRNTSALCGPFLRAALTYCEHSESPRAIPRMLEIVSKSAANVENTEGREYLRFFQDFVSLLSNYNNIPKQDLIKHGLNSIPTWAPALLTYYDSSVRTGTEDFLQEILFGVDLDVDQTYPPASYEALVISTAQQLGFNCLDYLHDIYIRQRLQAVRSVLVNVEHTIELCDRYFGTDDYNSNMIRFKEKANQVLPILRKYMVEEPDEEASDWDGSEEEYGSSEPMDSITELCGPMDNELEVQL